MHEYLQDLLKRMKDNRASDLHLSVGQKPHFRVSGVLYPADNTDVLSAEKSNELVSSLLTEKQRDRFEKDKELDFSISISGVGRFRANIFLQCDSFGGVFRRLPYEIPGFEELNLPVERMESLASMNKGMVLVTGATGSGKSTTLAAMIGHINHRYAKHIMCVEDPIEYKHAQDVGILNQREVGQDTLDFGSALIHVLRQDPDVVQIGEMRDQESIRSMLTVAETGPLAFSTLHTNTAPSTITRIIDVFPHEQQEEVRVQLSMALEAVISQQLLPHANGKDRVLAYELMLADSGVRNIIRQNAIHQLPGHIQISSGKGMRTMNASLAKLVQEGKITQETALYRCTDKKELEGLLRRQQPIPIP